MFTFLILISLIGLALVALSWAPSTPAGLNVLTVTEAEEKLVADESAKAKSWLSRLWTRIAAFLNADVKTDQES
jgi:hypothetical protein